MWYRCFFLLLLLIFSFPISLRRLVDVHRVGRGLCWRSYIASCTTAAPTAPAEAQTQQDAAPTAAAAGGILAGPDQQVAQRRRPPPANRHGRPGVHQSGPVEGTTTTTVAAAAQEDRPGEGARRHEGRDHPGQGRAGVGGGRGGEGEAGPRPLAPDRHPHIIFESVYLRRIYLYVLEYAGSGSL